MTVVMQHWFDNLEVTDDGFTVTLNFGDSPETLYVPYDAIQTFVDPSVEFGLRFESQDEAEDEDADDPNEDTALDEQGIEVEEDGAAKPRDAEVVSLDSFRK